MSYPIAFGKYLLLERINVGGMAEVFKAKTFGVEGFERVLAIKRILPNMADDDEFINMFVDEARIAVQLSHANIVQIYELGKFHNQYYIAMEYVPGKDLRQILDYFRKKKETLPIPVAAYLTSRICEGLDYAHRRKDPGGKPLNLIHRDVSPQNILVGWEGAVKITDFGIAKAEDRASKTQAGVLKGKFGYMSPEQVRGLEIDQRSDVFALGILLYEMLTGKRLFIGESDFSTLEKVRNADVEPPTQHNPNIPPALEQVMLKCLAKERDERYQWASDLYDDLQQFLIEDTSVYNAKKMTLFMTQEFQSEIDAEKIKMEEFMRLPAPNSAEAWADAQEAHSAPHAQDDTPARGEKTVIFESGFDQATAATNVGPNALLDASPTTQRLMAGQPITTSTRPANRHLSAIIIAGAAFVSLLILLIYLLVSPPPEMGTIRVTSPVVATNVYLDGKLVATQTPAQLEKIPAGKHVLWGSAQGYRDKAYSFELAPGQPAAIHIALEPVLNVVTPGEASLEVSSDPTQATVRIGGLPQGITPLVLRNPDVTRPIILEVGKAGYQTEVVTVQFEPTEKNKKVKVKLRPTTRPGGDGKLSVRSKPERAIVYIGRAKKGVTPLDLQDLDTNAVYELEIAKDGFRSYRERLEFAGLTELTVNVVLEPDKVNEAAPKKAKADNVGGCTGSGGKVSVMPIGVADCKVTVGANEIGVAPMFRQESPTGSCTVKVSCPNGNKWKGTRAIKAGSETKIIIKPEDWEQ